MPKCKRKRIHNRIHNLNTSVDRPFHVLPSVSNMKLYFSPPTMVAALECHIGKSKSVVGCMAWMTHPTILNALERVDSTIIMTKHRSNRWKRHIKVKFIGKRRLLMHHKFIVGCNDEPEWVSFGSFNATKSATSNLEHMVIVHDKTLAKYFYNEYKRLLHMTSV